MLNFCIPRQYRCSRKGRRTQVKHYLATYEVTRKKIEGFNWMLKGI